MPPWFGPAMMVREDLWHPDRRDLLPILIIILFPAIVAIPTLLGPFHADPIFYTADIVLNLKFWLTVWPYIDPNSGFQTQALGHLAIRQWLHGLVPWWNSYTGVGVPLGAEYQSSVFSPLTFLLGLPNGMLWQHLSLQVISGGGGYALLRQLGSGRLASLTGALLLAENGTLAWFDHGPAFPGIYLPWVILGVERAAIQATRAQAYGWRLLGISTGMMLLAGFPETAFICELFAFIWATYRLIKIPTGRRFAMIWRLTLGAGIGLALAAPQVMSFLEFLPISFIDSHKNIFAHTALPPLDVVIGYFMPYAVGPIFAYGPALIANAWSSIGGYVDAFEIAIAAVFVWHRRDLFCWTMMTWLILTSCKIFGIQPISNWWNDFPGVSEIAFFRYCAPTTEFTIIILGALGIDMLARQNSRSSGPFIVTGLVSIIALFIVLLFKAELFTAEIGPPVRAWMFLSIVWAVTISIIALIILGWFPDKWRSRSMAALLLIDATVMYSIPILSNAQSGTIDRAAIAFLQDNLGFERFSTLGPIAPNYGAYFEIASIDHNYLPVPLLWADWASHHLDTEIDPYIFNGTFHPNPNAPSPAQELNRNLPAYEEVGVKYVVTPAGFNPFTQSNPPKVYSDPLMDIYQLPKPAPYFETPGAACSLQPQSRTAVTADCPSPTTLIRRELFFPGWHAAINGHETPIIEQNGLFEAINLPAGQSKITYSYAPPHIIWAWLLMALALITLITPSFIRRPKTV